MQKRGRPRSKPLKSLPPSRRGNDPPVATTECGHVRATRISPRSQWTGAASRQAGGRLSHTKRQRHATGTSSGRCLPQAGKGLFRRRVTPERPGSAPDLHEQTQQAGKGAATLHNVAPAYLSPYKPTAAKPHPRLMPVSRAEAHVTSPPVSIQFSICLRRWFCPAGRVKRRALARSCWGSTARAAVAG